MIRPMNFIKDMQSTVETLNQLVNYLSKQKEGSEEVVKWLLTENHPVFAQIARITNTPYRVYFKNKTEMAKWLEVRQWSERIGKDWDLDKDEWIQDEKNSVKVMTLRVDQIFDEEGRLRVMTPDQWDDDWIEVHREQREEEKHKTSQGVDDLDDEIPF